MAAKKPIKRLKKAKKLEAAKPLRVKNLSRNRM
jgi:hypothetical protein